MPFIIPTKRQSVTGSKKFSHYKNVETSSFFILQKKKSSGFYANSDRPQCRIVTAHAPFYEVAYGDDLDEMKKSEWRYLKEKLPQIIPTHLQDRYLRKWLRAHITQIAVENIESLERELKEDDGSDGPSGDEKMGESPMPSPMSTSSILPKESQSSLTTSPSPVTRELVPPTPSSSSQTLPPTPRYLQARPSITYRPNYRSAEFKAMQQFIQKQMVEEPIVSKIKFKGLKMFLTLFLGLNFGWMLLRDCSPMTFWIGLITLDILLALLVFRGRPVYFELLVKKAEEKKPEAKPKTSYVSNNVVPAATPKPAHKPKSTDKRASTTTSTDNELKDRKEIKRQDSTGSTSTHSKPAVADATPAVATATVAAGAATSAAPDSETGHDADKEVKEDGKTEERKDVDTDPDVGAPEAGEGKDPAVDGGSPIPDDDEVGSPEAGPPAVPESRKHALRTRPSSLGPSFWGDTEAKRFSVRCGPNYPKNKFKRASKEALFELTNVDVFKYENKIDHIASKINVPYIVRTDRKEGPDDSIHGVPPVFVVNFQLPSYQPENPIWGGTKNDGQGYSLVIYWTMTEKTRRMLQETPSDAPNCYGLLKRFCQAARKGEPLKGRLKAIPHIVNYEELEFNSTLKMMLEKYNGKPFLTGPKYHTFHAGPNYIECDVDLHRYQYLARKVTADMLPSLNRCVIDLGIVVEALGDEEQPEQILGCVRFFKIDPPIAKALHEVYTDVSPSS